MRDLGDERLSRNFAGSLLVAHPNMVDPNFRRTVLFVSEHEPNEGALGVIINRPLDRPVAELVTGTPPAGLADVAVLLEGRGSQTQSQHRVRRSKRCTGAKKLDYGLRFCRLRRLGSRPTRKRGEAESLGCAQSQSVPA